MKPQSAAVPLDDQVFTLKETAGYFGVDKKTIKRWIDEGPEFPDPIHLPFFERKQLRFKRADMHGFRELLRTQRVKRIKKKFCK